ncbi:MAG: ABC transporter permease [Nanoarchaeota archaeon]|nr:ABC transporter permease [Nanoarchaeota archaeon]
MLYALAIKNLLRRKSRTLISILGIAIGIAMIVSLVSISEGIQSTVQDSISKIQGISVMQKGAIDQILSSVDESYADKISQLRGVRAVSPEVFAMASTVEGREIVFRMGAGPPGVVIGIYPKTYEDLKSAGYTTNIIEGRFFKSDSEKSKVVIGKNIASKYNKRVNQRLRIDGESFKIIGVFESGSNMIDNFIVMHIDDARDLFNLPENSVNSFMVDPSNPAQSDELAKYINRKFSKLHASTSQEFAKQFGETFSVISLFTLAVSSVAAIVGGLGIANTMLMSVIERTKEIGVLKSVGWYSSDVLKLILFESIMISVIGLIVGVGIGSFVALYIFPTFMNMPALINLELLLLATGFSIGLGLLGGIYPAYKAANMSPLEAFRGGD